MVAHEGVAQKRPGPDLAAGAHGGPPQQVGVGAQQRVAPDLDAPIHVGGARVFDGHPGEHQSQKKPVTHGGAHDGELDA